MEEVEYCDPFNGKKRDYFMKLEHTGRYVWARDFITKNNIHSVADITCANGYGTKMLSAVCEHVDGYDVNSDYLKLAKKRNLNNADFITCDLNKDGITNKYDAIVSFETMEHIDNTDNFVKTLSKAINNDGYLLLSVPNPKYELLDDNGNILSPYHKHILSKQQVVDLFEKQGLALQQVLGQSLCNHIVSNLHELKHNESLKQNYNAKLLSKHNYSKEAIIMNSYIYSYPDRINVDDSYSYIYVFKKSKRGKQK